MPNMKDVAKKANVGIATVSRVINNSGFVSKETRTIVERAIDELGYIPNELARNFQKNKTNIIGVIVPEIHHEFTNNLLKEIERVLRSNGYLMMVGVSAHDEETEKECINKLVSQQVGGLIITAPIRQDYSKYKFPIVSFDREINKNIPYVHTDNYGGGNYLTNKLIDAGCEKLLFVNFNADDKSLSNNRMKAFKDVCKNSNVEHNVSMFQKFSSNTEYLNNIINMQKNNNYDGLFFGCDIDARRYLNLYFEKHQKFPCDHKIVSFDSLDTNTMYYPKLDSAGHNFKKIASTLISLIFSQMNDTEYEHENMIDFVVQDGSTL